MFLGHSKLLSHAAISIGGFRCLVGSFEAYNIQEHVL